MWECLLFNVQSEAIWIRGLQVPLTLLPSCTQWGGVFRLGSRSARGSAAELGLFLLPWQRRLTPPSICSFGTYSCNDYEQSLIKLQRIIPRNHRVCMCVRIFDWCLRVCWRVVLSRLFACLCADDWCISQTVSLPLCMSEALAVWRRFLSVTPMTPNYPVTDHISVLCTRRATQQRMLTSGANATVPKACVTEGAI